MRVVQQGKQVLTGQKLEVIKLRIAEEIEGPYKKVDIPIVTAIISCCFSMYK